MCPRKLTKLAKELHLSNIHEKLQAVASGTGQSAKKCMSGGFETYFKILNLAKKKDEDTISSRDC